MAVLYRHLKPNGEVFYIGIGNNRRPYDKYNRSTHWKGIIKKYGYEVQILKSDLTWEDACDLENILINYYGRKDLGLGTLVNHTDGGEGIQNISDETRKKMSDAKLSKDPWNKGIKTGYSSWNKGMIGISTANKTSFTKGNEPWNKNKIGCQTGEMIGTSKLTEKEVLEIIDKFIPYKYTRKKLAAEYNVAETTIKDIVLRKSWKHLTNEKGGQHETD